MENLERLIAAIEKLAAALTSAVPAGEPDYRYPLRDYFEFDWASLAATAVSSDEYGATRVSHHGKLYTRRSGSGKFGEAIWFSRATGTGEDGTEYARLVTFKDSPPPEPLPASIAGLRKKQAPPAPSPVFVSAASSSREWSRAPVSPNLTTGWKTGENPISTTSPIFLYEYGNGEKVVMSNDVERETFDAYRRAHAEEAPPSKAGLRAWYAMQKQAET